MYSRYFDFFSKAETETIHFTPAVAVSLLGFPVSSLRTSFHLFTTIVICDYIIKTFVVRRERRRNYRDSDVNKHFSCSARETNHEKERDRYHGRKQWLNCSRSIIPPSRATSTSTTWPSTARAGTNGLLMYVIPMLFFVPSAWLASHTYIYTQTQLQAGLFLPL